MKSWPTRRAIADHLDAGGHYEWRRKAGRWQPGTMTAAEWRAEPFQGEPCPGRRLTA